jgi:hypothetical protein
MLQRTWDHKRDANMKIIQSDGHDIWLLSLSVIQLTFLASNSQQSVSKAFEFEMHKTPNLIRTTKQRGLCMQLISHCK